MRDSIMDGQDKFIMRESDNAEVGAREDCDEDLLDVGRRSLKLKGKLVVPLSLEHLSWI